MNTQKYTPLTLIFSIILMLAVLAGSLPQSAQAAPAESVYTTECSLIYTVKPGETIYKIARLYEVKVWELAKANLLTKPYILQPGMKLCIPEEYTPPSKLKLNIAIKAGKITLDGKNFPATRKFFVRIRPSAVYNGWTKLGWTASDSKGTVDDTFFVPKSLKNTLYVTVCLKDSVTDYLYCRSVLNIP